MNERTQAETMPMLLITGGAGFIGNHTARVALARGWEVRLLDDLSSDGSKKVNALEKLGVEVVVGDVRDEAVCLTVVEGCDAVIHLAAQVSVSRSMEYPEETIEINVGGTANLLKACKTHGVTRFVMASSAAVYGSSDSFPLEEKHAGASQSPYADSKWQNELQVMEAKKEGMQAIALRLFNVYGTGQRHQGAYAAVVPKFIDAALKGQPVTVFGDGLQTRDFIHVNDVAQALLMLATEPWRKELEHVYNVCTQTEISLLSLLKLIQNIMADVAPSIPQRAPNHTTKRKGDIVRSVGSNVQFVRDTAWTPEINFEDGLYQQIMDQLKDA